LENFKKLQGNVEFYQNKCHPGNAPNTRRPCAKATDVWAQWVAGWPVNPTFQPPMSFHGGDAPQEIVEWNLRPGVGGGWAPWLADHVARLAGQHLANYRLNQVGSCSWDSYKYPTADGIQNTTLYVSFSTCKGSSLVVEAQAKPYRES
jgi:hypothetical protein